MERLTSEELERAEKSAPASVHSGLAARSELWRQAAAHTLSASIFEHLVGPHWADDRQLTMPFLSVQMIADEA
jgi:hypothetical protein